jgi:hypothetical protein
LLKLLIGNRGAEGTVVSVFVTDDEF